jgi:Protein of unknown function (DUF1153)
MDDFLTLSRIGEVSKPHRSGGKQAMITFARLRRDGTLIAFAFDGGEDALPGEPMSLITPKEVEKAVRRGPDTLDELPSLNVKRWTARRKAAVVIAVSDGRILREEACRRYQLSSEELLAWEDAFKTYGNPGLHVARLQQHRRPFETPCPKVQKAPGGLTRIR